MPQPGTARFLDISVHLMTMATLTGVVAEGIATNQKWVIANHNMHSLYLYRREAAAIPDGPLQRYFRRAHQTHIDGISIVALARLYGQAAHRIHRIGYTDWLPQLMVSAVERSWRVYYLGSSPSASERGIAILRQRHPGLNIEGRHGFFNISAGSGENERVLRQIAEYQPHLLMVGMGMPRQECWIETNFEAIKANVILASGAALDYVAGVIPTPPRWSGPLGLEWAFRLAAEPKRLAFRYLVEPWTVALHVARDVLSRAPSEPAMTFSVKGEVERNELAG